MTRVRLSSPGGRPSVETARRLFAEERPMATVGAAPVLGAAASPLSATAHTLFGPRGATLLRRDGPLWVSDTGHHRLLGWASTPAFSGAPADFVIGQRDMNSENGRNGGGPPGPHRLNVPTGICGVGAGLAVADAWNHRVLIWREAPTASHTPADVVLGQADGRSVEPNRGRDRVGPDTMHWPYGVAFDGRRFYVADTQNRRVLVWCSCPTETGQPADLVLGQPDFEHRDENGGGPPDASSLRWPHQVTSHDGQLAVADAGNNRVLVFNEPPEHNNPAADRILGQANATAVDHNQGRYWPSASAFNMPYGIASAPGTLLVADTANSRLLGWRTKKIETGRPATHLHGQPHFATKGDNRWQAPAPDSLCWPYGVSTCGDLVIVSDSGNNRVQLFRMATS